MRWRPLAVALGAVALLAGGLDGLYHLARSRTTQLFATLVARVETPERVVALTFDDGPTAAVVDELLSALGSRHVRATFFVNGAHVAEAPETARCLVAAGHELGNHTYSHERMVLCSQRFIKSQVERTERRTLEPPRR
jgi:peptidoglycan/xylan/chitin deacetylase (PgdA/CDA1 family)